ncbi:MAG: universal stress protein [Halobellus sp.]|uniref:universal stress protein n=1 Tax=Halobellus sp. TaxID=1979212 RepID=UPI0035D469AE
MGIETVVLAVREQDDLTEQLAATTSEIAGASDAEVVLANVYGREEYDQAKEVLNFSRDGEVTPDVIAERHSRVRDLTDALSKDNISIRTHGRLTDDASKGERFVELAEEADADLLVISEQARSPAGKALFNSTAQEVLLNAPCPVTFVRAE